MLTRERLTTGLDRCMDSLRNKDRIRELCNSVFIRPIIYARTRSEHFTFIRIDVRTATSAKNTIPPVTYACLTRRTNIRYRYRLTS